MCSMDHCNPREFLFFSLSLGLLLLTSEGIVPTSCSSRVTSVQVEGHVFPATVKAPGSTASFFLGGAGVRGLDINGTFTKFTAIGVYLEESAMSSLALKWKGKSGEDLTKSVEFFRDIVSGPFEKFTQVRMILPLTGKEYSEKVAENCVAFWKSIGTYTEAEKLAIQKFLKAFETKNFPPGASILFTQSPKGSLTIGFSFDDRFPESGEAVIDNKQLAEAILESIIGLQGVSPAAKQSLAVRLSQLFNKCDKVGIQ